MKPVQSVSLILSLFVILALPAWAEEDEEEIKKDPAYVKLSPAFVVNLKRGTGPRFLQVKAEVLVYSPEAVDLVKQHMPAVRHTLIMQLSDQDGRDIRSIEVRERLRKDSEAAVKQTLTDMTGEPVIDGLFFTNYVVQ